LNQNETLDRISLIYNCSKDAIRKANDFTGDEIYMKKELIIPTTNAPLFKINQEAPKNEEQRKKDMIELMNKHIHEKIIDQTSCKAEALYYLESTNYNFEKAMKEFEEDLKYEKDQETIFRGQRGTRMRPLLYLQK